MYGYTPGWQPINPNSTVPTDSPLFVMLSTSLKPAGTVPETVVVNGQTWPVMPPPQGTGNVQKFAIWLGFNAASPRLIDALATWISNGRQNDVPKTAPLTYAALTQTPPPLWPNLKNKVSPILFVCSMAHDDGRRHKDGGTPDVVFDHVPANYWTTSQIFLTDEGGVTVNPGHLKPGEEYYVAAIIGNAGNNGSGQLFQLAMTVQARALAFNSFMGPDVPLPSLGNLDAASINADYEQFGLRPTSYDVVGFRFNVDKVFGALVQAVKTLVDPAMLGMTSPEDWVKDSHPCVKVMITAGDPAGNFPPDGGAMLSVGSDPRKDRHIAQRNLAHFDMTVMAQKKTQWKNFIVAQAGAGLNGLLLQHGLPLDAFRIYLAIPRLAWERYIDPKTSKGGAVRGFEQINATGREVANKPFPGDTVFLRQTNAAAEIHVADHAAHHTSDKFLGMALGLEGDPTRLRGVRVTDISMAHAAADRSIVGGFTVQLQMAR
jgi:hypothetical protein